MFLIFFYLELVLLASPCNASHGINNIRQLLQEIQQKNQTSNTNSEWIPKFPVNLVFSFF